jgi:ferritin-like metal-binding protein YciE
VYPEEGGEHVAADIHEQLTKYVADAHSIEVQALAQLESAPDAAKEPGFEQALREHRTETERHERLTRQLLEERDASPSKLEDMVMKVGGKGFLAFARVQPDTPGKLLAHSLSYEALENAVYELLARTGDRAGEADVSTIAREIGGDERAMMSRLEQCYDPVVEVSLREVGRDDLQEQLRKYLADAHAIEQQAITMLETRPTASGNRTDHEIDQVYEEHLVETREHGELVKGRLDALGGDPSSIKDAAMRMGALNWSGFFAGHPDTPGKLAAFTYAFEYLEIGGYEQLRRVARRAGDEATAAMAERILEQERTAARRIEGMFDLAVTAALEAVGVAPSR